MRAIIRRRCTVAAATVLGLMSCGPILAGAAVPDPGRPPALQAIFDCRKLVEAQARLACYDAAANAMDHAVTQGQVVVVDHEQVRAVRRQSFGFNIPSIAIFSHGPKEEPIDRVTVELSGVRQGGDGKWLLTTTDDALWRQIDSEPLYADPHKGSKMAIRKAALGSFFCNVDGQSAIRCVRDR